MSYNLKEKVDAVNFINTEANRLTKELQERAALLIGKKILTVSNILTAKASEILFTNLNKAGLNVYRTPSRYSLTFQVNTSGMPRLPFTAVVIYIGNIENHSTLKNIYDNTNSMIYKTHYTVDEIVNARKKVEEAKNLLRDAQSALFPFKEHDNF